MYLYEKMKKGCELSDSAGYVAVRIHVRKIESKRTKISAVFTSIISAAVTLRRTPQTSESKPTSGNVSIRTRIVCMKRDLQNCQPTSYPVERSFSMARKLHSQERPFLSDS